MYDIDTDNTEYIEPFDKIYSRRASAYDGQTGRPLRVNMKAELDNIRRARENRRLPDTCWECLRFGRSGHGGCPGYGRCRSTKGATLD